MPNTKGRESFQRKSILDNAYIYIHCSNNWLSITITVKKSNLNSSPFLFIFLDGSDLSNYFVIDKKNL